MKRYCISLILAATAAVAVAQQDLNKEIVVDRDYVPVEQKASKLNVLPTVYSPKASATAGQIDYSDWAVPSQVEPKAVTLSPYPYGTTHEFPGKRGYFEFGIGSLLNMLGSAGFRVVDFDDTKMSLWLQHNSTWNGRNRSANSPVGIDQQWNDNVLGIDFSHRFAKGTLSANAFYHYDNFNYFGRVTDQWFSTTADSTQTINEFRVGLGWTGPFHKDEGLNYSAHVAYNYFGFSDDIFRIGIQGNSENHLKLTFNGEFASSEHSHIGLDLGYDFVNYNLHYEAVDGDGSGGPDGGNINKGIVRVSPYYAYRSGRLSLKVGANLDVSFNDGAALRLAPRAEFRYTLTRGVQFYAQAIGGKQVNTLSRLFSQNRYVSPQTVPVNPYTPLDVVGGLKIGPFAGFNATIYGGWARVKNAMMPTLYVNPTPQEDIFNRSISQYSPFDIKGWRAGGEMRYAIRTVADALIAVEYSPQDCDKGYIMGDDRAELVVRGKLTVYPIDRLSVMLGYQFRSNRALIYRNPTDGLWLKQNLKDVNRLTLGANYRLNSVVGFFVQVENVLNRRWDTHYGMGAQPLNVIGGVSLLF